MKTILVVEDDRVYARVVANWLVKNGLAARYVLSVASAKEFIAGAEVGLVLSDYRLQDGNGVELLEWMKAQGYRIPFLVMTGYGDIPGAVEAVRKGATDYLPKPVQSEKVLGLITGLLKEREKPAQSEWAYYRGTSPLAVKLQEYIRLVAPVDTLAVLIRGASGTGKEHVARQVHALSERADAPFIAVDCGVLPKELAASELFGHMKGFDREAQKRLKAYSWPGNIRELRTVVRRATLLAKDGWITSGDMDLPYKPGRAEVYALNDERTERTTIRKALEATGNDRKAYSGCWVSAGVRFT